MKIESLNLHDLDFKQSVESYKMHSVKSDQNNPFPLDDANLPIDLREQNHKNSELQTDN